MLENEQWRLRGDCSVCRKEKYCSKRCKANEQRSTGWVYAEVAKAMLKAMVRGTRGQNGAHEEWKQGCTL